MLRTVQRSTPALGGFEQGMAVLPRSRAIDLLEPFGATVVVRRACQIYRHDEPAAYFWRIVSGCARTVKVLDDGRRQIGEFLWPGDLLGLSNHGLHYFDAEAVTHMTLCRYPRHVVEAQAATHTMLALWLRTMTASSLQGAQRQMVLLGRKTALEKIASFLLEVYRRSDSPHSGFIELPMSRGDIADHLGLSIETVCRSFAHLHRASTLSISRSGVELCDRVALTDMACD